jgi:hypothetical protein
MILLRWVWNMLADMWEATVADAWSGLCEDLKGLFKAPSVNNNHGQGDDKTPP